MKSISVQDLEHRAGDVLRQVRDEGTEVEVTDQGRVVARIVPAGVAGTAPSAAARPPLSVDEFWAEWDKISKEISAKWPKGVSAVDAVREQRREL